MDGTTFGTVLSSAAEGFVPGFLGHNDVCAYSGQNCDLGDETGIAAGAPDLGIGGLGIIFEVENLKANITNGLTLDAFSIKVQTGPLEGDPTFELAGVPSLKSVPEPSTLFLLGFGLAGLAGLARRRILQ